MEQLSYPRTISPSPLMGRSHQQADMPVFLIDHGCEHGHTLSPTESLTWGRFGRPLTQPVTTMKD